MDELEIKAIVEGYGCRMHLEERVRTKGNGKGATYVKARGHGKLCSLGNLDTLTQMSEVQLRSLIAAKFALPPVTETISGAQFLNILMGREG